MTAVTHDHVVPPGTVTGKAGTVKKTKAGSAERENAGSVRERDPRPLGGYAALVGTYTTLAGGLMWSLLKKPVLEQQFSAFELLVFGLGIQHVSRLIAKDSVTAVMRAPFTQFKEAAGEGEVNEVPVGTGLGKAAGELITCPFCIAQWVATVLVAGRILAPRFTSVAVSTFAIARLSDYLQLSYGFLRSEQ